MSVGYFYVSNREVSGDIVYPQLKAEPRPAVEVFFKKADQVNVKHGKTVFSVW